MTLADVIFPAPSAAYFVNLFFPLSAVLALTAEFAVFVYFQRGVMSKPRLLFVVVGVNLFSWLVGIVLSGFLPSGLVPRLVGEGEHQGYVVAAGPHWDAIAILSFFWACMLSFVLEYSALRLLRKQLPLQKLALCVAVANIASYCVIGAVVAIELYFGRF
jgi:hypothetical protein